MLNLKLSSPNSIQTFLNSKVYLFVAIQLWTSIQFLFDNYVICSFIRSNRVRDSWVKLIFTSVCGGAVGFLSINDQICIHGVKSKLSSTFYQLLQASLIYLSKLFAILFLLNILKEIEFQSSKFQKGKNLSYY